MKVLPRSISQSSPLQRTARHVGPETLPTNDDENENENDRGKLRTRPGNFRKPIFLPNLFKDLRAHFPVQLKSHPSLLHTCSALNIFFSIRRRSHMPEKEILCRANGISPSFCGRDQIVSKSCKCQLWHQLSIHVGPCFPYTAYRLK